MTSPFYFRWPRYESGYTWVETPHREEGALHLEPVEPARGATVYCPLEEFPALYRRFAEVDLSEEGVIKFADEYGNLSNPTTSWKAAEHLDGDVYEFHGHVFKSWVSEIRHMRDAVKVWDMICARDMTGLSQVIRFEDEFAAYNHDGHVTLIAAGHYSPELLDLWTPGDYTGPGYGFLQRVLNKQLRDSVSPRALWGDGKLQMRVVPRSLSAALWLQLLAIITAEGRLEHRRCGYCNRWFEVSGEGARSTRKYCSDSCKVLAYRKRKKEGKR